MEYKDKSVAQKSLDNIAAEMKRIDNDMQALKDRRDGLFKAMGIIEAEIARDERAKERGDFAVKIS